MAQEHGDLLGVTLLVCVEAGRKRVDFEGGQGLRQQVEKEARGRPAMAPRQVERLAREEAADLVGAALEAHGSGLAQLHDGDVSEVPRDGTGAFERSCGELVVGQAGHEAQRDGARSTDGIEGMR